MLNVTTLEEFIGDIIWEFGHPYNGLVLQEKWSSPVRKYS
jgi:hypothetical protein